MFQTRKDDIAATDLLQSRYVVLQLNGELYALVGEWQWDLHTDALYCTDVIAGFPHDFEGTKALLHPDDKEQLLQSTSLHNLDLPVDVSFRIITTYGEIKLVEGRDLLFSKDDAALSALKGLSYDETELSNYQLRNEAESLRTEKLLADVNETVVRSGSFCFNISSGKAYYSNNVFRLFRIPPQSLNMQLYTFAPFIHPADRDTVMNAVDLSIRRQAPIDIQYCVVLPNEEERFLQHTTRIVQNARGETLVAGILRDITPEKEQEKALETAQTTLEVTNKLMALAEQVTPIATWFVDLATRKFVFSHQFIRLFGLKPQAGGFDVKTLLQHIHPDDHLQLSNAFSELFSKNTLPDLDYRIIRADGKQRQLRQRGKLISTTSADMYMIVSVQDVTSEKVLHGRLDELMQEAFVRDFAYQNAEQLAGIAGFYMDVQTQTVRWSGNMADILGIRNASELTITRFLQFIDEDHRKLFENQLHLTLSQKEPADFNLKLLSHSNNSLFKCRMKIAESERAEVLVCLLQNISETYNLQKRLQDRISFIELLSNSIHDKIIVTDSNYTIIEWNQAAEKGFKKSRQEIIYRNFYEVFPNLRNNEVFQLLRRLLDGEADEIIITSNAYLGTTHRVTYTTLKDEENRIIGVLHVLHDISNELQLQQRLSARLNFIESLVEVSVDPIIVMDKNLNYIYWNKKSEELFGINKEYALGKNILELVPDTHNNPTHYQFRQVLAGETLYIPPSANDEGTFREVWLVPISSYKNEINGLLWMVRDLTERKKAE